MRTRRETLRTAAGAVTLTVPAMATVTRGETESGYVEVYTEATVPAPTSITITVYEDLNGDGTAENTQTQSVPAGTNTLEYNQLDGQEDSGVHYWMDITLETNDDTQTPSLDQMTITLPAEPPPSPTATPFSPGDKKSPGEIWDSFLVFVSVITLTAAGIAGLGSRSMAVGSVAAYTVFAYLTIQTGHTVLTQVLYATLTLIVVGMAFKLWRAELGGGI